jgi:VanZ family protein
MKARRRDFGGLRLALSSFYEMRGDGIVEAASCRFVPVATPESTTNAARRRVYGTRTFMQRIFRIACLAYVVFLSLLLFSPNPSRLVSMSGDVPVFLRALMPWAHLLSFSVFAVLMLLARWPLPRWSIISLLALYGGASEIIQSFIPPRTPEWIDWVQDLGGVAVGVAICSFAALIVVRASHYVRHATERMRLVPGNGAGSAK